MLSESYIPLAADLNSKAGFASMIDPQDPIVVAHIEQHALHRKHHSREKNGDDRQNACKAVIYRHLTLLLSKCISKLKHSRGFFKA